MIIDNTPFPKDGSFAEANVIVEFTSTSAFRMSYNLRSTSIYMGILSMILSFTIGTLMYLTIKVHREIKKKFESEEESEEEEDDEVEDEEGEEEEEEKGDKNSPE